MSDGAANREFIEVFTGWAVNSRHLNQSVSGAAGHGEQHGKKPGAGIINLHLTFTVINTSSGAMVA